MVLPPKKAWIPLKADIRQSSISEKGMFAREPVKKGEKVVVWGGAYVTKDEAEKEKLKGKLVMQWDENLYSVEDRGDDDSYFINHSCDPNLWMSDAFTLVARKNIKTDEEITADYALWEADEKYISAWECHCGSALCRKRVTGKDWRLHDLQNRYQNHFSPLINKRILDTSS